MKESLRRFKAEIFQALAHPTRIAIVEALRDGEMPAGKLTEELKLEQANASQHFAILRAKQIVVNRKVGNHVFYSLRDPVLIEVLDVLKRYFYSHLTDTLSLLEEIGAGAEPLSEKAAEVAGK
jgi:DNA-binding transcriptional ArsR family regulator